MVKSFKYRITVDNRGKISCGKKREGSELPQSLDYFDISDFPELMKWYGEKPKRLLVFFPTDNILDFFDTAYNVWYTTTAGRKGERRTCDGETCLHYIDENIAGIQYAAGEETECICKKLAEDDKNRCRYDCYFKTYVGNPTNGQIENPCCYMFSTHSDNSADSIFSELDKIKSLNHGILRLIPFELSVAMHDGPGGKRYPIISLRVWGFLSTIKESSQAGQLQIPFIENAPVPPESKQETPPLPWEKKTETKPSEEKKPENTTRDAWITQAAAVIGNEEKPVTDYCIATKKLQKGQTWRDLPESSIKTIIKSGKGFMVMVSNWIDNR